MYYTTYNQKQKNWRPKGETLKRPATEPNPLNKSKVERQALL